MTLRKKMLHFLDLASKIGARTCVYNIINVPLHFLLQKRNTRYEKILIFKFSHVLCGRNNRYGRCGV